MTSKGKWAIFVVWALFVSLLLVNYPATACFGHTTSCEGESVYQGDGGSTNYWYDHLYPPHHEIAAGTGTDWLINVRGGGGCSGYEHATFTDNTPPSGWTTSITMGTIHTGSFHFIDNNDPVNPGDDIEDREFYIGNSWNFDVLYNITAPSGAAGGEFVNMTCTVYVVGYNPENQHDYVYVHCEAVIGSFDAPQVMVGFPNGGEMLNDIVTVEWIAFSPIGAKLTFDVLLSYDSGVTYPDTLISGWDMMQFDWDTSVYPDGFNYRIMVIAFDGTNYGHDTSDDDFTLDNHAPDPPPFLNIHFGLTSSAEATSKGLEDNTDSDLERIQKDDSRAYAVQKQRTLNMDTFNVATQNDPVESAMLYVEYWVENSMYSGTESVMWKLDLDLTFSSTGITPMPSENMPVVKTFDLFAAGVDTIDEIANLDIRFWNNDGGGGQNVSFDYIWVTFKASSNDLGLTWLHSPAVDVDHYHIYKSPDGTTFSFFAETSLTYWNDVGTAADLNNYFYQIRAVDFGLWEGPPSYTVGKYVSSVASGWNLASTPLEPLGDASVSNVLVNIDQNYASVQGYHAGESKPWHHWAESKPAHLNSFGSMDHMHGYYLDVGIADDFITLGRLYSSVDIPLKTGWNLIGYPSLTAELRDTALSTISGNYDAVFRYDTAIDREVEVMPGDQLEPGMGYWVHVKSDCTLTI